MKRYVPMLVILAILLAFYFCAMSVARGVCEDHGGKVTPDIGSRSGWTCLGQQP